MTGSWIIAKPAALESSHSVAESQLSSCTVCDDEELEVVRLILATNDKDLRLHVRRHIRRSLAIYSTSSK